MSFMKPVNLLSGISLALILIFTFHISAQCQTHESELLTNAIIIDGDASVKPYKGSILIAEGLIAAVYKEGARLPSGVKRQNCEGKFICPALTDSHVHLATFRPAEEEKARRVADSIVSRFVNSGILTVRDMAGNAPFLQTLKNDIRGGLKGPDIFFAAQFAGPSYFRLMKAGSKDPDLGNTAWYRSISKTEDVKPAVAAAKAAGATGIKIYDSLSKELVRAISREAQRQGLQAWSHASVFPTKPIYIARAGVNSMSHANDLVFQQMPTDSIEIGASWRALHKGMIADSLQMRTLLQQMKKRDIILDATLYSASQNKLGNAASIARWAFRQGIKISAGTDWVYPASTGTQPLEQEVLLLHSQCGMTTLQAIEACVKTGPEAIGLHDRGLVRKGKIASLLILDHDPSQSLSALFHPVTVLQRGKVVFSR